MSHQMRRTHLYGIDPIRIVNFLKLFRTKCIPNDIYEGAVADVLPFSQTGSTQERVKDLLAQRYRKTPNYSDAPPSGSTCPELLQFLLIRYVHEETLAFAYEQFHTYTQAVQED